MNKKDGLNIFNSHVTFKDGDNEMNRGVGHFCAHTG